MPNIRITPYQRLFPGRSRRVLFWIVLALVLLALLGSSLFLWRLTAKRVIPSRGGLYFFRNVALDVPEFRQGDPRWHTDPLGGNTTDTLGQSGCAVSSAAMVLKSYGIDTDPQRLNTYLTKHDGYVGSGYLVWERAADLGNGSIEKAYEIPSYWRIDHELMRGNPVIIRLHFPNGRTHFVVIAGKRGYDYLIRDPGAGWSKGLYPLHDLTPQIDALRYYHRK